MCSRHWKRAKQVYAGTGRAADVADVVFFASPDRPMNISEVLLMPTDQAGSILFNRQAL